jgi:hypothetical protein
MGPSTAVPAAPTTSGDDVNPGAGTTIPLGHALRLIFVFCFVAVFIAAFVPVYVSGQKANRALAERLRTETLRRTTKEISTRISAPMDQIASYRGLVNITSASLLQAMTLATFDPNATAVAAVALYASTIGLDTYAAVGTPPAIMYCAAPAAANATTQVCTYQMNTVLVVDYDVQIGSYTEVGGSRRTSAWLPLVYDPALRPWYIAGAVKQTWTAVYVDVRGYGVATAVGPLTSGEGAVIGRIALDFSAKDISTYMRALTIGTAGRALLLDATSQSFWGGNFPQDAVYDENGDARLTLYNDLTDSTIVKIRNELGVAWPFGAGTRSATVGNKAMSRGAIYVDVTEITDDYGLDMRLMIAIPEADYAKPLWDGAVMSVAVTCGVAIALLIGVMAVLYGLGSALARVVDSLYAAALLDVGGNTTDASAEDDGPVNDRDDGGDDNSSSRRRSKPHPFAQWITEIVRIESAFAVLHAELAHIKGFLPAHILQAAEAAKRDAAAFDGSMHGGSTAYTDSRTRFSLSHGGSEVTASAAAASTTLASGSMMTAKTRTSGGGRFGGATAIATPTLGLVRHESLQARRVTVAAVNTWRFCESMAGANPDALRAVHAGVLRRLERGASLCGGSVDVFVGDLVFVSWNAATACSSHRTSGAEFACRLAGGDAGGRGTTRVSVGVASSAAYMGVVGSSRVKRFAIVGPCVGHAAHLERLCRAYTATLSGGAGGAWGLNPLGGGGGGTGSPPIATTPSGHAMPFAGQPLIMNLLSASVFEAAQHEIAAVPVDAVRLPAGSYTHASSNPANGIVVVACALPLALQDLDDGSDMDIDRMTDAVTNGSQSQSTLGGGGRRGARRRGNVAGGLARACGGGRTGAAHAGGAGANGNRQKGRELEWMYALNNNAVAAIPPAPRIVAGSRSPSAGGAEAGGHLAMDPLFAAADGLPLGLRTSVEMLAGAYAMLAAGAVGRAAELLASATEHRRRAAGAAAFGVRVDIRDAVHRAGALVDLGCARLARLVEGVSGVPVAATANIDPSTSHATHTIALSDEVRSTAAATAASVGAGATNASATHRESAKEALLRLVAAIGVEEHVLYQA